MSRDYTDKFAEGIAFSGCSKFYERNPRDSGNVQRRIKRFRGRNT